MRLYVNGTQVASRGDDRRDPDHEQPAVDRRQQPYGEYFQGLIDEVRVYNRALTQPEIQTDMNAPLPLPFDPFPPGRLENRQESRSRRWHSHCAPALHDHRALGPAVSRQALPGAEDLIFKRHLGRLEQADLRFDRKDGRDPPEDSDDAAQEAHVWVRIGFMLLFSGCSRT